MLNEKNEN